MAFDYSGVGSLQYPGFVVPQASPSSLQALFDGIQAGQKKRLDENGYEAAATLGNTPSNLAALSQQQGAQPPAAANLPAVPVSTNPADPTVGDRAQQLALATGASSVPQSYVNAVEARESGGDPTAANPNSSALGPGQFTDGTWQSLMQQHPELGLTPDGRTDPAQAQVAIRALTTDNAKALASQSLPVNPSTLYLSHFLGAGGAAKALTAPDDASVADVLPDAAQANPTIAGMNVGQLKAWAGQGMNGSGGYSPGAPPSTAIPGAALQPVALPNQATMLALLRSPDTRPLAMGMIQAYRNGQDPSAFLDNAIKQQQLTGGAIPEGYQRAAGGGLQTIPGGPDDPNTPANAARIRLEQGQAAYYGTMGGTNANGNGNGTVPGTTGSQTIDPTAPGYSDTIVAGGLTQAAIDQRALGYLTSGQPPPQGRSGIAGMQSAAIANRMAEMDPTGNLGANKAQLRSLSQSLGVQQKYLDTTQRSVENAEAGFSQVVNVFQGKINTSQYPTVNAAMNAVAGQLQPGDISAYRAGLSEVANEYSQVFSRGGQATDAVRAKSASILNGDLSIDDLNKVLNELQAQGNIVVNGAKTQIKRISGQINGIAGAGQSGGAASAPDSASAPQATATNPQTGQKLMLQNGQWVPAQ